MILFYYGPIHLISLIKITMSFLLISETQFHFLQVRPLFLVPRCMPFHLTVLTNAHECVLAKKK